MEELCTCIAPIRMLHNIYSRLACILSLRGFLIVAINFDRRGHGWLARYQQVSRANYKHAALGITPTKHMLNTRLCDACIESPYTVHAPCRDDQIGCMGRCNLTLITSVPFNRKILKQSQCNCVIGYTLHSRRYRYFI